MMNGTETKSKYYIVLDIVGLEVSHINSGLVSTISQISSDGGSGYLKPVFPSVTCTVQSSVLSGTYPNQHGIISNGLFDRDNLQVSFWEQSSKLVKNERIWDVLKKRNKDITTALLFWQNSMYANSDFVITPRPIHLENGQIDMWCYSKPINYYEEIVNQIGEFNLFSYWGPFASIQSSEWIGKSVNYTIEKNRPNLLFAYFPQVDYSAQKYGRESTQVKDDLKKIDAIVESIINKTKECGIFNDTEFLILSEYQFNNVNEALPINRILRDNDLLAIRTIRGKEYIDFEYSKAFAMVDHQVANIYLNDVKSKSNVKKILENIKGIDIVCDEKEKKDLKIDHSRSGDLIIIADKDKWFSYYWWEESDEEKAPSFTKTVDIHRKPGYDPLELFMNTNKKSISFDTSLIKSSHGRPFDLETGEGLSAFATSRKLKMNKKEQYNGHTLLDCTDIFNIINSNFS